MCRSMQKKMDPPGRCSSSGVCVGIRQGVLLCSSGHAAWPRFLGVETHYWQRFAALDGVRLAPCAAECSWTAIAISTGTQARHGLVGKRGGCGCLCEVCVPVRTCRRYTVARVCMHAVWGSCSSVYACTVLCVPKRHAAACCWGYVRSQGGEFASRRGAGNQACVPLVASVWCRVQATRARIGMQGGL